MSRRPKKRPASFFLRALAKQSNSDRRWGVHANLVKSPSCAISRAARRNSARATRARYPPAMIRRTLSLVKTGPWLEENARFGDAAHLALIQAEGTERQSRRDT